MRQEGNLLKNLDWLSVSLYLLLCLLGWANIYAAVYNEEHQSIFDLSQRYGKQLLWILSALALAAIVLMFDGSVYSRLALVLYIAVILSLIAVLFFGLSISGARSWFGIGSFRIQPSEFAKFSTALALAWYLSRKNTDLKLWSHRLVAMFIAFLPAILLLPQPDLGSALVYSAFFLVLYREGLPSYYIFIGLGAALLFILTLVVPLLYLVASLLLIALISILLSRRQKGAWKAIVLVLSIGLGTIASVDYAFNNLLEDRHRNRLNIMLGKAHDPQGIGYNSTQSMIAIGSGGFSGKGFLEGTQTKFNFVPEQSTDFIFCTVGEEWGFLGSSLLIILYLAFFFRLVVLAERQKSSFARAYGYGVLSIFFLHFVINIAMTIGLAPVVGIPLPFFSYGGSSLWGFSILLFIFLRLDAFRWQTL